MRTYFEHISGKKVQAVLNCLLEAPFFYRGDDEDLFLFLRRHGAEFSRFFSDLFGWELVVDARSARLYKTRWHNRALKPSQHDVFDLTRRDECVAFLLVLLFYEHLLEEQNAAADDPEPVRFRFGQLVEFAAQRFAAELGAQAPDEEQVRKLLRGLIPTLLRYRFLRELPPPADERGQIEEDFLIYECLSALCHYDVRLLGPRSLARALSPEAEAESESETETAEVTP